MKTIQIPLFVYIGYVSPLRDWENYYSFYTIELLIVETILVTIVNVGKLKSID